MKNILSAFVPKCNFAPEEETGCCEKEASEKKVKILFVGHSFTQCNNMLEAYFKKICKVAGYDVETDMVVVGWDLYCSLDPNDMFCKNLEAKLKSDVKYDYVIAQDQSRSPVVTPKRFFDGARRVAALAKENGASMWFSQTWGYGDGHVDIKDVGGSTEVMEKTLRAAYDAAAEELGVNVAHVGEAMYFAYASEEFKPDVFVEDCYHPSVHGSILIAWTTFASLFKIDPFDVEFDCGIDAEELRLIKEFAKKAVFDCPPVAEGYKIADSKSITHG